MQQQMNFRQSKNELMSMKFDSMIGASSSQALAETRTETGGRTVVQGQSEESPDAEGGRLVDMQMALEKTEKLDPTLARHGSVEPADEDRGGRGRRSGGLGHDGGGISEPSIGFPYAEDEPAKPSRDYRITKESLVGEGSLREKAQLNIEAIRLLKTIEAAEPRSHS